MFRFSLFISATLFTGLASAQQGLAGMIETERRFAADALLYGTRNAFLKYLDTNCINFEHGAIVNSYRQHLEGPESGNTLAWSPEAAGISAAGDLGFTTGPFTVSGLDGNPIFCGQFTSIWQWKGNGWKNILDVGLGTKKPRPMAVTVNPVFNGTKFYITDSVQAKLETEDQFIRSYSEKGHAAYADVLCKTTWINRPGYTPAGGADAAAAALESIPDKLIFHPIGSGISSSGDLIYVYGQVLSNDRPDNYLRVWVREDSGWKLALQYLGW